MQNLGFSYKLLSFSKRSLLFFTNNPNVQAISLNTQKSRFSSFLIPVIKTVLFTFCPTRKKTKKKEMREAIISIS